MTNTTKVCELAEKIAAAHGGVERWRRFAAVDVRFSAKGLAFWSKGQPSALAAVVGRFGTATQAVRLQGQTPRRWSYEVEGAADLLAAVQTLSNSRRLRWTIADAATFAATAMWTYLNLPFLLLDPGVSLELLPPTGRDRRRLSVRFPRELATHSLQQVLTIDTDGLIRRHDYTARAIGRWAAGSQTLDGYAEFGGIRFATRRRVTPRVRQCRLPVPNLVQINIHDLTFVVTG